MLPQARLILASGHAETAVLPPDLGGAVSFVQKPFTPEVLARRVREVLDSSARIGPEAARAPSPGASG